MYPIDCFNVENDSKIEAVRYFIYLNKCYLKEVSREEYELFVEFLKGEGKDILLKMQNAKTDKELTTLFNKIVKALPYASKLAKVKGFEAKINEMHKVLAKLYIYESSKKSNSAVLKKQREIATKYDNLLEDIKAYKDAFSVYLEIKGQFASRGVIKQLMASKYAGATVEQVTESLKTAVDGFALKLKEKRNLAFEDIREYCVKEQLHMLEQEVTTTEK